MENPFGELPLVNLLSLFAVLAVAILTVGTIWAVRRFGVQIRRLIIATAEVVALLTVIVSTLVGGMIGVATALSRRVLHDDTDWVFGLAGFLVGAASSFVVAALVLAIVFLLIEIADNTKKTAIYFNQLVSRAQA